MSITQHQDFEQVLGILRSLYSHVQTLQEYIASVRFVEGNRQPLVSKTDGDKYKKFIANIIVCRSADSKPLVQPASFEQLSTLKDQVTYTLKNICDKRKRNVLAHGLASVGESSASSLSYQLGHSTSAVSSSPLWNMLLRRLGTAVMKHLLECCALFTAVPPSCMFQVSGVPVYDAFSPGTHYSFKCARLRSPQSRSNILLMLAKTKLNFYKKHKKKSRQGPRRSLKSRASKRTSKSDLGSPPAKKFKMDPELATVETKTTPPKAPKHAASPLSVLFKMHCMLYSGRRVKSLIFTKGQKKQWNGLETETQTSLTAEGLVKDIFLQGESFGKKSLPKRFRNMLGIFAQLLTKHKKCSYVRLLRKNCSDGFRRVPEHRASSDSSDQERDFNALLRQYSSPFQVYMFVRECLHVVFPHELWGSNHNRSRFLVNLKKFLLMGKFDTLTLLEVLWKMRVNDCDWLKLNKNASCPAIEHRSRERILGQFLSWVLESYVVGLLKSFFFATESAGQKNALRFYKTWVWRRLQSIAFGKYLLKGKFELVSPEELRKHKTPVLKVRFIPKPDGMRPIVKMGRTRDSISEQSRWKKSLNIQLRNLYDVLNVNVKKRPSLLGSSLFGIQDIYRVLGKYAEKTKKAQDSSACPQYFVKVDVASAFDNLPHDKLLDIVSDILSPVMDEEYSIRRYAQIWPDTNEGLRKSFKRHATTLGELLPNMRSFTAAQQEETNLRNAILVEQGLSTDVFGCNLLKFFKEMLENSVLQIGKNTYRQCCGIPQGSIVSTLLCSLCYGDMENRLLKGVKEDGCMLRLIDDFLLITPHLSKAQTFLRILAAGVPEYGCFINPHKTVINFPIDDIPNCSGVKQLPPACLFPWCGLLMDTSSLDIYYDYRSYAGVSIRYSLTLGSTSHPGQHMKKKLMSILKLKCHAIYLDLKINSVKAVYLNIYKIFLIQAYRFHACVINLPFGQKVCDNPSFFLTMISAMAIYGFSAVRLINKGKRRLDRKLRKETLHLIRQVTDPPVPPDFTLIIV
ncbi:telomerase reverse transcriptase isoform X2 [Amia ocellicauda]|uniref:telomerase reverse transcriptase isoform X2 n=1 Tax=Amia ocellicauda TaxID=2972642 RepID=UPI003463C978